MRSGGGGGGNEGYDGGEPESESGDAIDHETVRVGRGGSAEVTSSVQADASTASAMHVHEALPGSEVGSREDDDEFSRRGSDSRVDRFWSLVREESQPRADDEQAEAHSTESWPLGV